MGNEAENEAIFGVVPALKKEKSYGFWDVFLISCSYMIATWCYTQGSYMAQELSFRQLLASVFGPNMIFITLVALSSVLAVRYGVDIWVWLRSVFGDTACKAVCVLVLIMVLPWFAVCADTFAGSMINLGLVFGFESPSILRPILSLFCILLGWSIALGGPGVIKWTSRIMVAALFSVAVIVVVMAFTAVPLGDIVSYVPAVANPRDSYALGVEACAAFAISPCLAIAVIPRLCKSERSGYWGTVTSYAFIAPFFIFAGGVMTLAMFLKTGVFSSDPTEILANLGGRSAALLSLILVAFANIGTAGSGTYMHSLILKAAFPQVKFKWVALCITVYMGILALWGGVTELFGAFISYSAFVQAPVSAMLLTDFFLVRKQKVSLRSVYAANGRKVNPVGLVCLLLGFLAGALVYNPATGAILSPIFYFTTASGLSFIVGGLSYFIASRLPGLHRYFVAAQPIQAPIAPTTSSSPPAAASTASSSTEGSVTKPAS